VLILMPDEGVAIAGFIAAMLDGLVPVMLTPETSPARAAAVASAVEPGAALVAEARADEAWLRGIPRTFRFTEPGPA
jgi:acyl-CoA synthetase (AMP-forming)/AMP-acid ligase II